MITFKKFLEEQEKIYKKFQRRAKLVAKQGVVPCEISSAYTIVYRHSPKITKKLAQISRQIARVAPVVIYNPQQIHVTLKDYQRGHNFVPKKEIITQLCNGVSNVIEKLKAPTIKLGNVLYNQECVIIEGHPDKTWYDTTKKVIESCRSQGINLGFPWGTHTSFSRFNKQATPEQLQDFFNLIKNLPKLPKQSTLKYIDVGWGGIRRNKVILNVSKRFKIPN